MDIRLHHIEQGAGFSLILLHGNGEDHTYFTHQIEHFSKQFRVIALDTRGHGQSPRGDAPFTIQQFAEDLRSFLDEQHIDKAHILGFSDGGNVALTFALQYPERVERLILNGANLDPRGVKRSVQWPIEWGYRIASLFAKKDPKAKKNAEMLGLMVNEPNILPEHLHTLVMPTLVVAGSKDMIKHSHTQRIYEHLPHAQLAILPGDHFIASRNSEAFNQAVEQFLKKPEADI